MTISSQFTVSASPETLTERLRSAAASEHTYRLTRYGTTSAPIYNFEKVTQRSVMRGWRTDVVYTAHVKLTPNEAGGTNVDLAVTGDTSAMILVSILPIIVVLGTLVILLSIFVNPVPPGDDTRLNITFLSIALIGVLVLLLVVRRNDFLKNRDELRTTVEYLLRR